MVSMFPPLLFAGVVRLELVAVGGSCLDVLLQLDTLDNLFIFYESLGAFGAVAA